MDINQPIRNGEPSIMQKDTEQKSRKTLDSGRYYNANYGIENFVNSIEAVEGTSSFKVLNDPTYAGFKLFFHFDSPVGLLADEDNVNSALAYLKRIGHLERYELLKRFINVLSKVNSICPWMFQDIEGLQAIYADPYEEIYKKHQITINCLETVDGKMLSLIQMYKAIVYDHEQRKFIVPINLRRFSMSIYVYDYRVFSDLDAFSVEFLQTIQNTNVNNINHTLFDLGYCQFDATSGGAYFTEVSNNRSDANINNLVINFEKYDVSGMFKTILGDQRISALAISSMAVASMTSRKSDFDSFISSRSSDKTFQREGSNVFEEKRGIQNYSEKLGIDKLNDKISSLLSEDAWRTRLERFKSNTEAEVINAARGQIARLYLGNVYGFDHATVLNIQNDSLVGLYKDIVEIPSLSNSTKRGDLGNVND